MDNNVADQRTVILTPPSVPVVPGDIDGNGIVDMNDVAMFTDVLIGIDTDPTRVSASDLNGDGKADGLDVAAFSAAVQDG